MALWDIVQKAKKKVEDFFSPEVQTVKSGLSKLANNARSFVNGAENVGRSVGNFVQKYPTPASYVNQEVVPRIQSTVVKPIQTRVVQPTVKFAKDEWSQSMFNPNSEISKKAEAYRNSLPEISKEEARAKIKESLNSKPMQSNDVDFAEMPIVRAVKQKSIKPLYEDFLTPEGRQRMVNNFGKSLNDPMNAIGMGETQAVGKITGRVVNNAIKKGVSSEGVQKIIKVGEQKLAPVAANAAKNLVRSAGNLADDFMDEVGHIMKPAEASLDDKIAAKTAKAKQLITQQIENQRQGLKVAEKGFVPPQSVRPAIAPKSGSLVDAFKTELESTPVKKSVASANDVPFKGNEFSQDFKPLKEAIAEKQGKTVFDVPEAGFNKYQKAAYDAKGERIDALREVINYPNELRKIGYKKGEIDRIGKDQADRIIKLGNMGYPKNEIQKFDLDRMDLIIKNNVPWESLKNYNVRKHALDTNFLEGVDPSALKDINPLMGGNRDVYRNFEATFGNTYPKIKQMLLDPFDAAKGNAVLEQENLLKELEDSVVNKLGIKKGSKLSEYVQKYGENKLIRPLEESDISDIIKQKIGFNELKGLAEKTKGDWRTLVAKKLEKFPDDKKEIILEQLKQSAPDKWQNVLQADDWFRNKYGSLLDELNQVREANFPTHPLFPESTKVIPKRNDYYRHFQEFSDGFSGIKNLFESPSNIDPSLAVASEFTKPKSKWLSFAQRRTGDQTEYDAVGGFLDYLKSHSYAKNIDPFIQKFRGVDQEMKAANKDGFFHSTRGLAEELSQKMDPVQQMTELGDPTKIQKILMDHGVSEPQSAWMSKELAGMNKYDKVQNFLKNKLAKNKNVSMDSFMPTASAEKSDNKLNNFLKFVDNFANDLSGKTNPMDRWLQDNIGRRAFKGINMINSRIKANTILGNLSSAVAQAGNVPQGIADAGVVNSLKGMGDSLASIFSKNHPMNKSSFIRERYFNGYNKFDTGMLENTKNFAAWITGALDEAGTKLIWNAEYRKALANGADNAVKYADDLTRKMVAGRGIGEVPINQKAKSMQLVAPFQLEVQNLWYVFHDWKVDKKLMPKMIKFAVASYLYNGLAEKIRGSRVSLDPLNAMSEAYKSYNDSEDKVKGAEMAAGRMAGEAFKNVVGGQTLANMYPEKGISVFGHKMPNRKDLMGKGDPTRFGSGGISDIITKGIQDPLYKLVPPFGGVQIKKTLEGAGALAKGYAENAAGNIMTPVENNVTNALKGLMFGKSALSEVKDYYDNELKPLSAKQTEQFKLKGRQVFDDVQANRQNNSETKKLKESLAGGNEITGSDRVSKYAKAYGYDKLFSNVSGNSVADAKARQAQKTALHKLYSDKNVPDDVKNEIYGKIGVDKGQLEMDMMKSLTVVERAKLANDMIKSPEDLDRLVSNKVLTVAVANEMENSGLISAQDANVLRGYLKRGAIKKTASGGARKSGTTAKKSTAKTVAKTPSTQIFIKRRKTNPILASTAQQLTRRTPTMIRYRVTAPKSQNISLRPKKIRVVFGTQAV